MQRIHARDGKPFCRVSLRLDEGIFAKAPDRFSKEIVVSVLKDLGVEVFSARQKVTISYADFDLAQALDINVNSAVFREFFGVEGKLIYSASLFYPGDILEPDIACRRNPDPRTCCLGRNSIVPPEFGSRKPFQQQPAARARRFRMMALPPHPRPPKRDSAYAATSRAG